MATTEKTCSHCGVTKPASDFSKNSIAQDGRNSQCKACRNSQAATKRSTVQQPILMALRHNGQSKQALLARFGDSVDSALESLVNKGLVQRDAQGFYELTATGKLVAPSRNPAYAKRFLSAGAQAQAKAH